MDMFIPLGVVTATVDADVLVVLCAADSALTGRQVHQVMGKHSERGVRNTLNRLADQGIVTRTRAGAADLFALNTDHLAAPHIINLAGLRAELAARVAADVTGWDPAPQRAWLAGAATDPEAGEGATIRVLVLGADPDAWAAARTRLAERIGAWTGNPATVEVVATVTAVPETAAELT